MWLARKSEEHELCGGSERHIRGTYGRRTQSRRTETHADGPSRAVRSAHAVAALQGLVSLSTLRLSHNRIERLDDDVLNPNLVTSLTSLCVSKPPCVKKKACLSSPRVDRAAITRATC